MNAQLEAPRWKGGPPICTATNLPAFVAKEKVSEFYAANAPSCSIKKIWECPDCGLLHVDADAPSPSGSTSGNTRTQKEREP